MTPSLSYGMWKEEVSVAGQGAWFSWSHPYPFSLVTFQGLEQGCQSNPGRPNELNERVSFRDKLDWPGPLTPFR